MIFGGGIFALAVLALWIYCILDVIATDEVLMRNLPKPMWLLVVVFLPSVGGIAWLLLGRPEGRGLEPPGGSTYRRSAGTSNPRTHLRPVAPDDDPRFLTELDERAKRLRAWEADLKRREDRLRNRDEDEPPPS